MYSEVVEKCVRRDKISHASHVFLPVPLDFVCISTLFPSWSLIAIEGLQHNIDVA